MKDNKRKSKSNITSKSNFQVINMTGRFSFFPFLKAKGKRGGSFDGESGWYRLIPQFKAAKAFTIGDVVGAERRRVCGVLP